MILKNKLLLMNVTLKYFPTIIRSQFIEMFKKRPILEGYKRKIT